MFKGDFIKYKFQKCSRDTLLNTIQKNQLKIVVLGFITPGRPPREPVTFEDG
jgi:hypothetical protein